MSQTEQAALTSLRIKKRWTNLPLLRIRTACANHVAEGLGQLSTRTIHKIYSLVNKVVSKMHINSYIESITNTFNSHLNSALAVCIYYLKCIKSTSWILKSSKDVSPCSVKCLYLSNQAYLNAPPLQC